MAAGHNSNAIHPPRIASDKNTLQPEAGINIKYSNVSLDDLSDVDDEEYISDILCRNCKRSRACCATLYVCIFLFCMASFASMIVIGIAMVEPYRRVAQFHSTTCQPILVHYLTDFMECSCGKRCNSGYPCLFIEVITTESNVTNELLNGQLRNDESLLARKVNTAKYTLTM